MGTTFNYFSNVSESGMELLRGMDYYVLQDVIKKYSAVPDNDLALTHDICIPTRLAVTLSITW